MVLGASLGYVITIISPSQGNEHPLYIFLSGYIAICAMILPGISGSFILLLMGMYSFIIKSLIAFHLSTIIIFSLGCGLGLLSFSKFLSWLFKSYPNSTISFLTGLMLGSLNKVWPWKQTLSYTNNRHGERIPLLQENILPNKFLELTGENPMFWSCTLLAFLGFIIVLVVELKLMRNKHENSC